MTDTASSVGEHFIEKLEVLVSKVARKASQHSDAELSALHQKLWLMTRFLRGDEDLSLEDIDQ